MYMNYNKKILVKLKQTFPMEMSIRYCETKDNKGIFIVKFSINDFCRNYDEGVPCSFFIECLGQGIEYMLQLNGKRTKRYLIGLNEFSIAPDIDEYIANEFRLEVQCLNIFRGFSKYSADLVQNDKVLCHGVYSHCEKEE